MAAALLAASVLACGCGSPAPESPPQPAPSGAADDGAARLSGPGLDRDGGSRGRALVAALGDSITAGSPLWDPDPQVRAELVAIDPRSRYEHWAERRSDDLEFRNCGVFGERTDEIAQRLESCAEGADTLIVQGGINDIAQDRPVEEAAADLERMVERGQQLGLDVAIADVLPWNNGYPSAAPEIEALNELIAAIGERHEVPVLEFHDALEDPQAAGRMAAPLTVDGDHPSVAGYRRLGALIELPLRESD